MFALTNGHIGMRGSFEEGEPVVIPGTYLNGFFEERPLPYAEAGYGFPEMGQTMVNVTDGKLIRLLVKDSPLDLDYGEIIEHTPHARPAGRRAAPLHRVALAGWPHRAGDQHPAGLAGPAVDRRDRVQGRAHRRPGRPLRRPAVGPAGQRDDPVRGRRPAGRRGPGPAAGARVRRRARPARRAGAPDQAQQAAHGRRAWTTRSRSPTRSTEDIEATGDLARYTLAARIPPGGSLKLVKYLAYGWSSRRSGPALRDQVEAALATAKLAGWDRLVREQRELLDQHWDEADVEIEGDDELQQAVRVGMFHVLQAGLRGERQPIPAKGLTGPGYDGHTFWDTETYVLPVLTYTAPHAVRDALRWRHSTLDMARDRARVLGRKGAAFPWRTIRGEETSGYWPAGTAAFHINADIADAVVRYYNATLDDDFDRDFGAELLIETARLWASLGHFDAEHGFRIDGVTGPDEYTAVVDNNVYTNLMAQRNLREAAEAVKRQPDVAGPAGRRPGRGGGVAAGGGADGGALRHPARRAHAVRRVHPPRGVGLRRHPAGELPAAAALPVLRDLPQAGGQAGRPGDGPAPARGRVHPRGEDRELRLLRGAHDPGLVALGEPAGGGRGRDRAPAAGLRLLGRGGADRPAEPAPQLRARAAHRLAGRGVDGRGGRVRRHARPQRRADLRPAAARADHPAAVPGGLPGPEADRDGHSRRRPPTGWRTATRSTSATTAARSPSTTPTSCWTSRRRRRSSRCTQPVGLRAAPAQPHEG